jgi:predicted RNase H-like HicB family nuclease
MKITAIIEREGDGYVSLYPELDIASQGDTVEQARDNLRDALELFFETASTEEIKHRLHEEVFVNQVGVELHVQDGAIILERATTARSGWAEAAQEMRKRDEDRLLDPVTPTHFDQEEWEW